MPNSAKGRAFGHARAPPPAPVGLSRTVSTQLANDANQKFQQYAASITRQQARDALNQSGGDSRAALVVLGRLLLNGALSASARHTRDRAAGDLRKDDHVEGTLRAIEPYEFGFVTAQCVCGTEVSVHLHKTNCGMGFLRENNGQRVVVKLYSKTDVKRWKSCNDFPAVPLRATRPAAPAVRRPAAPAPAPAPMAPWGPRAEPVASAVAPHNLGGFGTHAPPRPVASVAPTRQLAARADSENSFPTLQQSVTRPAVPAPRPAVPTVRPAAPSPPPAPMVARAEPVARAVAPCAYLGAAFGTHAPPEPVTSVPPTRQLVARGELVVRAVAHANLGGFATHAPLALGDELERVKLQQLEDVSFQPPPQRPPGLWPAARPAEVGPTTTAPPRATTVRHAPPIVPTMPDSVGGATLPPVPAELAAPAPVQAPPIMARVAACEEALGESHSGQVMPRLAKLEESVHGETRTGDILSRIAAVEEVLGLALLASAHAAGISRVPPIVGVEESKGSAADDEGGSPAPSPLPDPPSPSPLARFASHGAFHRQVSAKPPLVPRTKWLRQLVPHISGDLFTVTPLELVRKAVDELTLGLHWYVGCVLLHKGRTLNFVENDYVTHGDTMYRNQGAGGQITITSETRERLAKDLTAFDKSESSFDTRQLLKHIKKLPEHVRNEYYGEGVKMLIGDIQDGVHFFYHKNGLVHAEAAPESDLAHAVAERERMVAKRTIERLKQFAKLMLSKTDPRKRPRMRRTPNGLVDNVCGQLCQAAHPHFESVQKIAKTFAQLTQTGVRGDAVSVADKLHFLNVGASERPLNARTTAGAGASEARFALNILWTRFENRGTGGVDGGTHAADEGDVGGGMAATKMKLYEGQVRVTRSVLTVSAAGSGVGERFINQTEPIWTDPFGCTHLDYLNRALDVAFRALRSLLLVTARVIDKNGGLHARPANELLKLQQRVMTELCKVVDYPLVQGPQSDRTVMFWKETQESKVNLFQHFCAKHRLAEDAEGVLERFVRHEPRWADGRFLGVFLQRQVVDGNLLFPEAEPIITIRDKASHQQNLKNPQSLRRERLHADVHKLLRIVDTVAKVLGFDVRDTWLGDIAAEEVRVAHGALGELVASLPQYGRWRRRQYDAHHLHHDDDVAQVRAQTTLCALERALKHTGPPGFLPILSKHDGSAESLVALLRFVQVHRGDPRRASRGATPVRVATMYEESDGEDEAEPAARAVAPHNLGRV